jgi:hypothetical protein
LIDTHRLAFDAPPAGPVRSATDPTVISDAIASGPTRDLRVLNAVVSLLRQTPE